VAVVPYPRATEVAAAKLADEPYAPPKRWTASTIIGRLAVVSVVLGLTGMWIYALWGYSGVPGKMEDLSFSRTANPICQQTRDSIDTLPKAHTTPDHNVRAGVVDQATDQLTTMVDELERHVPAGQPEHDMIVAWLGDWRTYLNDRREYSVELRKDPMTRFAVTQSDRDKSQVTGALDRFARINEMAACKIPDDLA
jgi:hypothetical protein